MSNESKSHLQSEICRFLSDMLGQTVTPYEDLRAKGLDSVGFLEVVIFIEKELRIPFPLQLMSGSPITTVEAITEHLTASHPMIHGTR